MLKPVARIWKFFIALLIIKISIKLFWSNKFWSNKIIFRSVPSKILNLVSDIINSRVSDLVIRIGSAYTSIRLARIGQWDNTCGAIGSQDYNHLFCCSHIVAIFTSHWQFCRYCVVSYLFYLLTDLVFSFLLSATDFTLFYVYVY